MELQLSPATGPAAAVNTYGFRKNVKVEGGGGFADGEERWDSGSYDGRYSQSA